MEEKSFYSLDYIIQINQERLDQYTSAYQKVLDRFTHIVFVYSAITIFLIPLIQDTALFKIRNTIFIGSLAIFLLLLLCSVWHTIRFMIPVNVAYLTFPRRYYEEIRLELEGQYSDKEQIKNLLKGSYITELQTAIEINERIFRVKSRFFFRALAFALCSLLPYAVCLGFHIARRDDNIQKVQLVDSGNFRNFNKIIMPQDIKHPVTGPKANPAVTQLPGIDNSQVIVSKPNIIKENGDKSLETKVVRSGPSK